MVLAQDFPPLTGASILGTPSLPLSSSYAANLAAPSGSRPEWPMSYSKPAKKLSFASKDLSEGKSLWNLSLVGYSLGPRPYYERLRLAMERAWKLKGDLSLLSLADDFFLLKFTAVEDYDMVSAGGPWFLLGKPFILQRWDPKFQPKRDEAAAIPLWIKILNLPLALWTPSGISKIASYIGIPLYVDALTANRTRLTFARVCVEVNKDSILAEEIPMEIDGMDLTLKVVYDWKPTRCEGCGSLIHSFAICPQNPDPKPAIPIKAPPRGRSKSRAPASRAVSKASIKDAPPVISTLPDRPPLLLSAEPSSSQHHPETDSANIAMPNVVGLDMDVGDKIVANVVLALSGENPIDDIVFPENDLPI
ncbi:uncharacterized protein LOC110103220 [Dendrobium catenatum]|uniref:uncharacterized protein LOC110103220 n=1 Tax=Dendrobium catenatum TaxID=906689 RepID=UPI0009F4437E|nr:uncharacterized protein LOC110103220 [Dendrobium catenatum]